MDSKDDEDNGNDGNRTRYLSSEMISSHDHKDSSKVTND